MTAPSTNFQPTSLDFINRPNPVEPSNISQAPDSSSSQQLKSTTNGDFSRALRDSRFNASSRNIAEELGVAHQFVNNIAVPSASRPSQAPSRDQDGLHSGTTSSARTRDHETAYFTLPNPAANQGSKCQRSQVPPVLQGLHQPPPDAGLLPSMNAEKKPESPARPPEPACNLPQTDAERVVSITLDASTLPRDLLPIGPAPRPARRNRWTDEETLALLQGTRRFGVGNWKKILMCPDYSFNSRTATDLKDRFRVVSSNKEMLMRFKVVEAYMKAPPDMSGEAHLAAIREGTQASAAEDGWLNLPRAKRRQRTKWSTEEDDALLRGFGRYGPSWTSIQLDPVLKRRTPTDIRDRIRTRFPAEYTRAGLPPKPSKPRAQLRSQPRDAQSTEKTAPPPLPSITTASASTSAFTSTSPQDKDGPLTSSSSAPLPRVGQVCPGPLSALEEPWFSEIGSTIDPTHPLSHLLNNPNDDMLPPMHSLPPILPPKDPSDPRTSGEAHLQSIDPLVTVLGKTSTFGPYN